MASFGSHGRWADRMVRGARRKLALLRDRVRSKIRGSGHVARVFREIHDRDLWGHAETLSGPGSTLENTATLRRTLPMLVERYGLKRIVDAPCGDFNWMQSSVDLFDEYVGVDIVPELVVENQRRFGGPRIRFECADVTRGPLPACNVILSRDCFIHLPSWLIHDAIRTFRSTDATYLLLSSDPHDTPYAETTTGGLRSINFQLPPFNFPKPLEVIVEDNYADRSIGLWRLEDLG